jgi:hypothetical protein
MFRHVSREPNSKLSHHGTRATNDRYPTSLLNHEFPLSTEREATAPLRDENGVKTGAVNASQFRLFSRLVVSTWP